MISAWVVLLISFGAVAAAGGAVGLGIGIHRKATAKSKALKSEADLRVYMHKSKRNPNKERRLLKKFYKSKIRLANRILPTYDNMSYKTFSSKKLRRAERKRQKLSAQRDYYNFVGNTKREDKLKSQLENIESPTMPNTRYSYVEEIAVDEHKVKMPNNSIYCNTKSICDAFKQNTKKAEMIDSCYPYVMQITDSNNQVLSSVSSTNVSNYKNAVVDLIAERCLNQTNFQPFNVVMFKSQGKKANNIKVDSFDNAEKLIEKIDKSQKLSDRIYNLKTNNNEKDFSL